MDCGYGHGECKAPDTQCPHWQGTFCELDKEAEEQEAEREQYLLSPVLYQAYVDTVDKFEKYIKEHPEVVEEAARKFAEQFVDVKDVVFGDKVSFQIENPMKNVETKSLPTKMIFEDKTPFGNLKPAEIPVELHTFSYKGIRDCHKCVYEVGCHGNPVGCKKYKRDASDGGYYG